MPTDSASDIKRLSADQIETLRHVFARKNSKQIARIMGVSPHTVDERVRKSLKKLNVSNRIEAAHILARHGVFEHVTPDQNRTYQPINFHDTPVSGDVGSGRNRLRQPFDIELPFPNSPQLENRHALRWRIVRLTVIALAILAFAALYLILVGTGHRST